MDHTLVALVFAQQQIIVDQRKRIEQLETPTEVVNKWTKFCCNPTCHAEIGKICLELQSCFMCGKFYCRTCAPNFIVTSFNCVDCGDNSYCLSCFEDFDGEEEDICPNCRDPEFD